MQTSLNFSPPHVYMPDFSIEKQFPGLVAGIDEAGRGPLAGPVVASCVILNHENYPLNINDSKQISEKKREEIFIEIEEYQKKGLLMIGVGQASPQEIDEVNILNATKIAMQRAFIDLTARYNIIPNIVLVDGNFVPDISTNTRAIVKGDAKSLSIAAASIVAKIVRDRIMLDLAKEFPHYEWEKNKAYATKDHIARIMEFGVTEHHRKSFEPIKGLINNNQTSFINT